MRGGHVLLRMYLIPRFGAKPVSMITTEDIQRLKADLKGKAPKTVNNVLTVLNTALRQAVAWGVIDRMPCVITMLPRYHLYRSTTSMRSNVWFGRQRRRTPRPTADPARR
jgi:hypothetical protein